MKHSFGIIIATGFLAGCTATTLPPLPENNPANPQGFVPANRPHNVLAHDETTVAIQSELSRTDKAAKSPESMQPMNHGNMPGMQHDQMKMEGPKDVPSAAKVEREKKALSDEMKKTSGEMEKTSKELEKKTEETKPQAFYYTCIMHPQVHENHPGKCPVCGMTLVKKEGTPPK
ncbi:MAG TPA: heavy metal-binding domain-containing protein [Pyrinomonadaceae bacterium]|nr:heavy metal-binding domain-containing protein [Pyrinomonadaceae bacterium]